MVAPKTKFSIRPVTIEDLPAVRAQLVATWHATYDAIYGPAMVDDLTARWHGLDALTEQLHRPATAFLLAEDARAVLGSSYALGQADGTVHLSRLYISPTAQGRGIGTALLKATFAALPRAARHALEVEPKNTKAIGFYQRHGFTVIGRTSDCGGSSGVPALIMERRT